MSYLFLMLWAYLPGLVISNPDCEARGHGFDSKYWVMSQDCGLGMFYFQLAFTRVFCQLSRWIIKRVKFHLNPFTCFSGKTNKHPSSLYTVLSMFFSVRVIMAQFLPLWNLTARLDYYTWTYNCFRSSMWRAHERVTCALRPVGAMVYRETELL